MASVVVVEELLPVQTITSGQKAEWSISAIFEENEDPLDVLFEPDSLIVRYVTFKKDSQSISYDGLPVQGVTS